MEQEQLVQKIDRSKAYLHYAFRCLAAVLAAFIVAFSVQAQVADSYITVNYAGYSNGQYKLNITSNQGSCNADVHVQLNGKDFYGKIGVFLVKAPYNVYDIIKITDLSVCAWQGSSPTTLSMAVVNYVTTPVTFVGSVKLTQQTGGVLIEFDVADASGISAYIIHLTCPTRTIDMSIPVTGNGHYSTFVKL